MQTFSTCFPASTAPAHATVVGLLSGDLASAQAPTIVATNAFDRNQYPFTAPEQLAIPSMPTVGKIEFEANEPIDATIPAPVGNPLEVMMPSAARAAQPAADEEVAEDESGSSDDLGTARDKRRGDEGRKLRRIVGPRLVRARALSGFTQTEAATAMGYSTPAQVNLWEMGHRLPPIFELIKAAEIYSVSLDYLIGVSHEPDRDPSVATRHALLRGVRGMLSQMAELTVGEIDRQVHLIGPHASNTRALLKSGDGLLEAFGAFVRHNHVAFSNMRGGATLQRLSCEFEAALAEARAAIRLHDARGANLVRALAALNDADPLLAEDDEAAA
ncbi:MAG: helix-turn-helix domain-containing protein [Janthinobacterium lividum]